MIILGGGIIGLTVAWQLVSNGTAKVRAVIESEEFPAATEAAAGMLAPISEAFLSNTGLMDIGISSLHLYEKFLKKLQNETQIAPQLSSKGTLLVAEDHDGLEWLRNRFQALQVLGTECQWLSKSKLYEREPFLGSSVIAGVHIPTEREILVPQLCNALRFALRQHHVEIISKTVTKVDDTSPWTIIFSDHISIECERLIIAGGAWLDHLQIGKGIDKPTVVPNKGQLVIAHPGEELSLKHMIRTRHVYICPKSDGSIRLGASSEFIGQNTSPTIGNIRETLRDTWRVLPALDDAQFVGAHAGLRPSSRISKPVVEKGNKRGLYWAVGHGRSGILLAPWTGKQIETIITNE